MDGLLSGFAVFRDADGGWTLFGNHVNRASCRRVGVMRASGASILVLAPRHLWRGAAGLLCRQLLDDLLQPARWP